MNITVKNLEVRLSQTTRFDRTLLAPTPEYVLETDVHNIKELVRRVWRHSAAGGMPSLFTKLSLFTMLSNSRTQSPTCSRALTSLALTHPRSHFLFTAGKHVFGVSLSHLWERKFSVDLPVVVTACCEHISKYGTLSPLFIYSVIIH
jgi:hypothetical protein